jgi:predicted mannosyl-3-phosphoglycerate phosphatase (HAD superfamily)
MPTSGTWPPRQGGLTEHHLALLRAEVGAAIHGTQASDVREPKTREELEMLETQLSEGLDEVRARLKKLTG